MSVTKENAIPYMCIILIKHLTIIPQQSENTVKIWTIKYTIYSIETWIPSKLA